MKAYSTNLTVFKRECVPSLEGKTIFADKIYRDTGYWQTESETKGNNLLTPVKAFFSWLDEKTNIQRAYKCRSTTGLIIHVMGKITMAFIPLIFNY